MAKCDEKNENCKKCSNLKICWCFCGSFCTFDRAFEEMCGYCAENDVIPVGSFNFATLDTRFGSAFERREKIEKACKKKMIDSIVASEPIGPILNPDITIVAPCTGNTLAKIANGISDTPVTLGVKAHLRGGKPLVIALCTNDALGANLKNIATLMVRKNVFFVPMKQDDAQKKRDSLVCDFSLLPQTVNAALKKDNIRPIFLG